MLTFSPSSHSHLDDKIFILEHAVEHRIHFESYLGKPPFVIVCTYHPAKSYCYYYIACATSNAACMWTSHKTNQLKMRRTRRLFKNYEMHNIASTTHTCFLIYGQMFGGKRRNKIPVQQVVAAKTKLSQKCTDDIKLLTQTFCL